MVISPQCRLFILITFFLIGVSACSPEQPMSVVTRISPRLEKTLQTMNLLGAKANRSQTFIYTLTNYCDLGATKLLNGHPIRHLFFSLKDTGFTQFDYAYGLGFALQSIDQRGLAEDTIFEALEPESIQSMMLLVEKLKVDCVNDSHLTDTTKQ